MSTINSANVQVGQSNTPANNITLSTSAGGDLVVSKGASGALTEITRIKNNGEMVYNPSGTGAVATTVQGKLREDLDAINDFGADNTGATNTTTALLNFYNACISSGKKGKIRAGTYKVTTGVLVFDNGFIDKAWPHIETDGHHSTVFQIDSVTETNAAVLTWRNGTASSGVGKYWRGGSHGSLTINGSGTGAAMTSQHHISLTGTWGIRFGWMASNNCKGNSFHCPQALYGGTNPDPYANSFTHFDGIESNFSAGYGFYNGNYVGMDSWTVDSIRIIQPLLGGWYGIGSGNILNNWSLANVTGWAFDDGTYVAATGGSPQRNYIEVMEIDNCQNAIRLNRSTRTKFTGVRIPTRFQTTPNVTAVYWPLVGVDIAGGASASCLDLDLDIQWRVEAGGALANLGTYIQTTASGLFNATVDFLDNGALGITNANFLSKCTLRRDTPIFLTRRTIPLYDSRAKAFSYARGSAATTLLNSGYGTVTSVLAFPTQLSDLSNSSTVYDTSTYKFTAPRSGWYKVEVSISVTVAAGTLIRLGLWDGSSVVAHSSQYATTAAAQTYNLNVTVQLAQGATLYAIGNQNTGTASVACTPVVLNAEVRYAVQEI